MSRAMEQPSPARGFRTGERFMADTHNRPKAAQYRERAMTLRLLACRLSTADGRARLLALAESFEKLARSVELWETMAAAAD